MVPFVVCIRRTRVIVQNELNDFLVCDENSWTMFQEVRNSLAHTLSNTMIALFHHADLWVYSTGWKRPCGRNTQRRQTSETEGTTVCIAERMGETESSYCIEGTDE